MTESRKLLTQYLKEGSEAAFRELVSSYINLVYSTAIRVTAGDRQLAEDVTQSVFVALARKAATLPDDVMLGGWLHRHTRFEAAKTMRGERRRQLRERQAASMNVLEDHSEANLSQVVPVLDEAISQLEPEDRVAILLHFFEQKDFRAVGASLGRSEEAARKRVSRALDKLHLLLGRRGVSLSAAALGTLLTAVAVTAVPAGLATRVASASLTGAAAGGGIGLTLLKIMTWTKFKVGVVGLLVALGLAFVVVHLTLQSPADSYQASSVKTTARGESVTPEATLRPRSAADRAAAREARRMQVESAKQELSSLLERPQQVNSYPPPELRKVLSKFGTQWLEALPILLERLDSPDFETRHWSLFGIWDLVINGPVKDRDSGAEALALYRPKLSNMFRAESESVMLVKKGQKARITVDAFPDTMLTGEVTKVGVLPDSNNRWMNPDLKVYVTTIAIDGTYDWVKPGMSAKVEVLVNKLVNCVYIPVQAISPDNGKQVCYVANGLRSERREVQIGEFNDDFIEVKNGLKEGERVLLRTPNAPGTEPAKPAEDEKQPANEKKTQPASIPATASKA